MWSNKSFLIVGGSSGIGLEVTRRLVELGSTVTVWSRSLCEELEALGVAHESVDVGRDVSDATLPERLDGVAYFPGSINLSPFERMKEDVFLDDIQVDFLIQATQARSSP